ELGPQGIVEHLEALVVVDRHLDTFDLQRRQSRHVDRVELDPEEIGEFLDDTTLADPWRACKVWDRAGNARHHVSSVERDELLEHCYLSRLGCERSEEVAHGLKVDDVVVNRVHGPGASRAGDPEAAARITGQRPRVIRVHSPARSFSVGSKSPLPSGVFAY